jgi:hypothetical protein
MIMKAKNNKRSQQPVQSTKTGQIVKPWPMENSKQIANPKRTMNSKQIAKLMRTVKSRQTVKFGLAEQIARITEMEALFTKCEEAVQQLRQAIENKASITPDLTNFTSVLKVFNADLKDLTSAFSTLEAYYTSPAWRTDFEADEAGLLPPDLKRGVLSEDGIYNLLEEYKRVEEEMEEDFSVILHVEK